VAEVRFGGLAEASFWTSSFSSLLATRLCSSKTVHRNRTRETVQLLHQETPDFISPDLWPPNNRDLNPADY